VRDYLFPQAYRLACRAVRVRSATANAVVIVTPAERQDLEQEAALAVWKALQHYDSSRGSLRTFVEKVVANRFASLMRAPHWRFRVEPLEAHHLVGLDGIPAAEFRMDFQAIAVSLSETDRRLAAFLTDHSPIEASRALGIPRSTVYERIRRIRAAFENAGFRTRTGCGR
jgi:RNA polymerase sigma-70 factor (ECF subfamily)